MGNDCPADSHQEVKSERVRGTVSRVRAQSQWSTRAKEFIISPPGILTSIVAAIGLCFMCYQVFVLPDQAKREEATRLRPDPFYTFVLSYSPDWDDPRDGDDPLLRGAHRVARFPPEGPSIDSDHTRMYLWAIWRNRNEDPASCADIILDPPPQLDFDREGLKGLSSERILVHRVDYEGKIKLTERYRLCGGSRLALPVAWMDVPINALEPVDTIQGELGEPVLHCEGRAIGPIGIPYSGTLPFECEPIGGGFEYIPTGQLPEGTDIETSDT